jgi:hypothetical protein
MCCVSSIRESQGDPYMQNDEWGRVIVARRQMDAWILHAFDSFVHPHLQPLHNQTDDLKYYLKDSQERR